MSDLFDSLSFAGCRVVIDPRMPEDEVWLVQHRRRSTLHVHEGPQAGETVEVWLEKPKVFRIVNLGNDDPMKSKLPIEFKLERSKTDHFFLKVSPDSTSAL